MVLFQVVGVYQDIVKVTDTNHIQKFRKDVVDKSLAGTRGIGESEEHN